MIADPYIVCNQIGMDVSAQWLSELRETIDVSYTILDELEKCGHPYKRITKVVLGRVSVPVWTGETESTGHVDINPDCHDSRAIAHEIGHGFEELWRQSTSEVMGQSMAEAIRFFVEKRMGSSRWQPQSEWRAVIDKCCGNMESFKKLLDGCELHRMY